MRCACCSRWWPRGSSAPTERDLTWVVAPLSAYAVVGFLLRDQRDDRTLLAPLTALALAALARNKLEGVALMKGASLVLGVPLA